jgi:PST family polysaccharide transporter
MWGVQALTIMMQVAYLSIVSRIVSPDEFGAYAVAVLVTTLGNLIAQTGLGQAAARRSDVDDRGDGALLSAALLAGAGAAIVTSLTATLWARLWNNGAAAPLMILLSVAMPFLAASSVQAGILRRQARIRPLALVQLSATSIGMVMGAVLATVYGSTWTLCISPVVTAIVTVAALTVILGRHAYPRRIGNDARGDVTFSLKSTLSGVLTYLGFGLPQWVASVQLGAATFGNWNRAVAIGQVPVESVTRSIYTVVFPRFRDHRPDDQSVSRYWSNMLGASASMLIPATALVLPVVPIVTLLVLGAQWQVAAQMSPWVLAAAILTLHSSLLTMALESSAHFRQLWIGQFASIAVLALAAVFIWTSGEWLPLAVGFPAAVITSHAVQVLIAGKRGLLDVGKLGARYLSASALACALFLESYLVVRESRSVLLSLSNCALLMAVLAFGAIRWRSRHGLDPRTW